MLATSQNIAIEACSGRIKVYHFANDVLQTPDRENIKEKKEIFDCPCGRKFLLEVAEVNE